MKYIKTYESKYISNNFKYKVDDYVLLDINSIREVFKESDYNTIFPYYKNYGIIIDIPKQSINDLNPLYDVQAIDNNTYKLSEILECYIKQSQIIRKLTPTEIEDFNSILTANKFNL